MWWRSSVLAILALTASAMVACGDAAPSAAPVAGVSSSPELEDLRDYGTTRWSGMRLTNAAAMRRFLAAYRRGDPGRWEYVAETWEGDPISYRLAYRGEGRALRFELDTTQDMFGDRRVTVYACSRLREEARWVRLVGCAGGGERMDHVLVTSPARVEGSPEPEPVGTTAYVPGTARGEAPTIAPVPDLADDALPDVPPAATRAAVLIPTSPRAEPGIAYPFELMVHCGVDYSVDFDGSFWDLAAREDVPTLGGIPSYEGRMTLVTQNRARFDFDPYSSTFAPSGSDVDLASFYFERHEGPKREPGPCV